MRLSDEDIRRFHRQGFLVLPEFLTAQQVERFKAETRGYHQTLRRGAPPDVLVSWEPIRPGAEPRRVQQILHAERLSPCLNDLVRSEQMLEVIEPLLGPDLALFEAKILMKASSVGGPIPWHQDYGYWKEAAASPLFVNCMVYADDADEENGCLQVIPGSHTAGVKEHELLRDGSVFNRGVAGAAVGTETAVALPGKAGTAILFGALLVHASGPNRSARERRSFTVVYTPARAGQGYRERLTGRRTGPGLDESFPLAKIKAFTGHGPHAGQCAANYRRRELWRLATTLVENESDAWVELSPLLSEGESFAWFAARKPPATRFIRLELAGTLTSNRDDVEVVAGDPEDTLRRPEIVGKLGGRVGLLHLEGGGYFQTKQALARLREWIRDGTVIVVDRFYGDEEWESQAALAFHEFVDENAANVEYLGRADNQVVVKVRGVGVAPSVSCPPIEWLPAVAGIDFDFRAGDSAGEAPSPPVPVGGGNHERVRRRVRGVAGRLRVVRWAWRTWRDRQREFADFFPISEIPRFGGEGPALAYCPTHSRRRELWRYALSLIEDPSLCWCEFGVGEGESLDWLALHKPRENLLFGFDSFEGIPEPWLMHPVGAWKAPVYVPNRRDVVMVEGRFEESLRRNGVLDRLGTRVGLVHVDCDLYSSTKTVLDGLGALIGPGTVMIFDEFYGYEGWERYEVRAFRDFVVENRVAFEYLARSDHQAAVRITGRGAPAWSVRPPSWQPRTPGICLTAGKRSRRRPAGVGAATP